MNARFVVLHHLMPESSSRLSHWDIMVEENQQLLTWEVSNEPFMRGFQEAKRLPNHRIDYLDFEGKIAGDRGDVKRWDFGEVTLLKRSDDCFEAKMLGCKVRSQATFEKKDGDNWLIHWSPQI